MSLFLSKFAPSLAQKSFGCPTLTRPLSSLSQISLLNISKAVALTQQQNGSAESSNSLSEGEAKIAALLIEQLQPSQLLVEDISGGCGSMYRVDIESDAFSGKSLVQQHSLVYKILAEDIKKMHGIRLQTRAPKKN